MTSLEELGLHAAEEGRTGLRCRACHYSLNESDFEMAVDNFRFGELFGCPSCLVNAERLLDYEVGVNSDSIRFLDVTTVRTERWFHATSVPNWYESITATSQGADDKDTSMVHLGTLDTSWKRFADMFDDAPFEWEEKQHWTLYEVEFTDNVAIAEGIESDRDGDAPKTLRECEGTAYEGDGVTRYLNACEIPGSISLLANPHCFRVVGFVPLGSSDL